VRAVARDTTINVSSAPQETTSWRHKVGGADAENPLPHPSKLPDPARRRDHTNGQWQRQLVRRDLLEQRLRGSHRRSGGRWSNWSPGSRAGESNLSMTAAAAVDDAVAAACWPPMTAVGAENSAAARTRTARRAPATTSAELDAGATTTPNGSGSTSPKPRTSNQDTVVVVAAAAVDAAVAAGDSSPVTAAGATNSEAAPPKSPRHTPAATLAQLNAGAKPMADGTSTTSPEPCASDDGMVLVAAAAVNAAVPAANSAPVTGMGAANSAAAPPKTPRCTPAPIPAELDDGATPMADDSSSTSPDPCASDNDAVVVVVAPAVDAPVAAVHSPP